MEHEKSLLKKILDYLPIWVNEQKKNPLQLVIYKEKTIESKIKIYICPITSTLKTDKDESILKILKYKARSNILIIDEIISIEIIQN